MAQEQGATEAHGPLLDAAYRSVRLEPGLDCQAALADAVKELWLVQLPLDFDTSQPSSWTVVKDSNESFQARCQVDGVEYTMVQDNEAMSMQVYAAPAAAGDVAIPVARRFVALRSTEAPQVCFGMEGLGMPLDDEQAPAPSPLAAAPRGEKAAASLGADIGAKRRRKHAEEDPVAKEKKKKSKKEKSSKA